MSEPLLYKVVGPVFLDEGESAFLLKNSNGRVLSTEFGPGWIRLRGRANPESAWAIPLLAERRGISGSPAGGLIVFGATEQ